MVFQIKGVDALDAVVNVRLTGDEKIRLRDDARAASISMSELVRARYFGHPIIAHADHVMIKELRRIGGFLKTVHTDSQGAYSEVTAKTLLVLRDYIEKLADR